MTANAALLKEYLDQIEPLLELAQKAYGSRSTVSPQHDASREYTRLLSEYYEKGGSLLDMAEAISNLPDGHATYAGLRRRVTTKDLKPSSKRARPKFEESVYDEAVAEIVAAKALGTAQYHEALAKHYAAGLSLSKITKKMGLSSANPAYYAINRVRLLESQNK